MFRSEAAAEMSMSERMIHVVCTSFGPLLWPNHRSFLA